MTSTQRTRLYCCFKACSLCGAPRGQFCRGVGENQLGKLLMKIREGLKV